MVSYGDRCAGWILLSNRFCRGRIFSCSVTFSVSFTDIPVSLLQAAVTAGRSDHRPSGQEAATGTTIAVGSLAITQNGLTNAPLMQAEFVKDCEFQARCMG